jgi:hypothetical protein
MKQFFFLILAAISFDSCSAQDDKSKPLSPPAELNTSVNGLKIDIKYSQPAVKGRTIGKDIAPFGQVWRTGANEATTFAVNRDVMIEGKPLKAGKYALFTIPGEKEWVIIFNKQPEQWGAFRYDAAQDALRVQVQPEKAKQFTERMTFAYDTGNVALLWGDTRVDFSVQ